MISDVIYKDIQAEADRQDAKFGDQRRQDPFLWMTILGEEFGESCQAVLDYRFLDEWASDEEMLKALRHVREELIQVATVAIRVIEAVDGGDI
jgi:NTP pyrophosphatase (non-canonical NTP hydrolase)